MEKFFKYFSLVFFATSCANVGNISGGEPDTTPPQIRRVIPDNFHTNSNTQQIVLTFDEYLATTNLRGEITITPEPNTKVRYEIKGKSIVIKFEEPLESNTTYVINFGKGIADLNENNVLEGFVYVFSTGESIDSNFIKGRVEDMITSEPVRSALVGLYLSRKFSKDSVFYFRPDYYTKTDSNGNYRISYLPKDSFHLIAFTDKNNDFKIQPDTELAGIYPGLVSSTDSTEKTIYISPQEPSVKPVISRLRNAYSCFVTYQSPLHTFDIELLTNNQIDHIYRTKNRDTLIIYFAEEVKDSVTFRLVSPSSTDTVSIKRRQIPEEELQITRNSRSEVSRNEEISFVSNYPISKIIESKIEVFYDDTLQDLDIGFSFRDRMTFQIDFEKFPEKKYSVQILPKTIFFNENVYNKDTILFEFYVKKTEDFGEIKMELKIDTLPPNLYLVMLEKKTSKTIELKIIPETLKFTFKDLTPGLYDFWIYWDRNTNNWLDKGDVFTDRNPEVKILCPDAIEVRANWEVDYTWNISLTEAFKRFGY